MQGDDPQPTLREAEVWPSSTGADEKPSSGNAEGPQPLTKTTNPCSSDNETGAEAVEVTPVDPGDHSEVSGLGAADPENTECAQELETSDDVPRADDPNPAIVNGTADFAAPKRVDVQCSVGDDAVTAAVANEEPSSTSARNPLSPAEQPAESNYYLNCICSRDGCKHCNTNFFRRLLLAKRTIPEDVLAKPQTSRALTRLPGFPVPRNDGYTCGRIRRRLPPADPARKALRAEDSDVHH